MTDSWLIVAGVVVGAAFGAAGLMWVILQVVAAFDVFGREKDDE